MSISFPNKAIITTDKAVFHLTISEFKNRDTGIVEHYTINLGSKNNKCVQMNVPSVESGGKIGTLMWVEKVSSVCYMTSKDNKNLSQYTINLAFTIARDINPSCFRYEFDDLSSFKCTLPDGSKPIVSLKLFHIAFHGATWYEKYFGAKMAHNHDIYRRLCLNLYDSSKKPSTFSFKHKELDEDLMQLYKPAHTWNDFFQAIQTKYGDKKCTAVYPWILDAMYHIFNNSNTFDNHKWYIDLSENIKDIKTPLIPFKSYEDTLVTGGSTRKQKKHYYYNVPPIYICNPIKIQSMEFRKFLEK